MTIKYGKKVTMFAHLGRRHGVKPRRFYVNKESYEQLPDVFDHEIEGEPRQIGVITYFREPAWRGTHANATVIGVLRVH